MLEDRIALIRPAHESGIPQAVPIASADERREPERDDVCKCREHVPPVIPVFPHLEAASAFRGGVFTSTVSAPRCIIRGTPGMRSQHLLGFMATSLSGKTP